MLEDVLIVQRYSSVIHIINFRILFAFKTLEEEEGVWGGGGDIVML